LAKLSLLRAVTKRVTIAVMVLKLRIET